MKILAKMGTETLRNKCSDVESLDEAEVLISLLESFMNEQDYETYCISAPELGVSKNAAIVRTPDFKVDLINPKIIMYDGSGVVSLKERCISFENEYMNCLRYDSIFVENGLLEKAIRVQGVNAFLVQHAIDHLNGILYYDRAIRFAVVRKDGKVLDNDHCPCGSEERFVKCCAKNKG